MWFSKKDKKPQRDIVDTKKVYKVVKEWNDSKAEFRYRLYVGEEILWSDGMKTMSLFSNQGTRYVNNEGWAFVDDGDKAWARRIAKHYKIEMIK